MQLRDLPSVERVLGRSPIKRLVECYQRQWVVDLVRQQLEMYRGVVRTGKPAPNVEEIVASVVARAESMAHLSPRPVINATGVIVHTNLGRAPLSQEAIEAMVHVARGYSNLELELREGRRGSRQDHIQALLRQLTGAEAALVVNNNASAVLLALSALASGKEVIVSRGEAVEIGGGFRIPDVMRQSGATLVEVGTTNRTYVSDYENAITESTAVLLKVHASNFRVTGFVHSADPAELVALGERQGIPVIHDIGSGCLMNTEEFGMAHEPTPQDSIGADVGLVLFSGDKLLGGPQAGIVVGKGDLVRQLERHPLARAVRIDKVSLAGLAATLLHYLRDEVRERVPVWRMIATGLDELEKRASLWCSHIGERAALIKSLSTIGGGSLPGETLATWVVALKGDNLPGGVDGVMGRLRGWSTPVIGRIEDDQVVLDPRTVLPEEDEELLRVVEGALAPVG